MTMSKLVSAMMTVLGSFVQPGLLGCCGFTVFRARSWHVTKCGFILLEAGSCSGSFAKAMISSAFRKLTTAWLVHEQYLAITACASGLSGSSLAAFHSACSAASQRLVK